MKTKNIVKKTAYYGTNLLLPLTEVNQTYKAGRYAWRKHAERVHKLKLAREAEATREVSFTQAIEESGSSCEELLRHYAIKKRLWLALLAVALVFSVSLVATTASAGIPVSMFLSLRIASLMFMLLGFSAYSFLQAMVCQFKGWMLQNGQLTPFNEWRRSGQRFSETLSWRL
ncbi:conjugal transfer protein TraX [Citrobacter braakii]|uniref:conjugal transfer protein TraX n=1 Tax=Citrobacter braakii TaxID=57706 RepID=UPI00403A7560